MNTCDSGEPRKNRKPQVLTRVVHWFVVDPQWPPDKLAQEKIITLIYHWELALFKGNNHLAEQVPLQGLIDPGGRQSLGCGASPQKRSISEQAEMKQVGIISDCGAVAPGTLGDFLQNKDWSRENASRLP